MSKALVKSRQTVHISLTYQDHHFIIEVYQVGQEFLPISESMLTTLDIFVLRVPEIVFISFQIVIFGLFFLVAAKN